MALDGVAKQLRHSLVADDRAGPVYVYPVTETGSSTSSYLFNHI